jgi:hypothetical protein
MKSIAARLIYFAVLLFVAVVAIRGWIRQAKDNYILKEHVVQREDSLQYYKDAQGREHASRLLLQADMGTIKMFYRKEVDSLVKSLGIKEKQLRSFAVVGTQNTGTIKAKIDSVPGKNYRTFSYTDQWMNMHGMISDSLSLKYQYRDSLILSNYWKRKWFLGKKRYFQDGYSLNPDVHFTGLSGAELLVKEPGRFGVGPCITYSWDGQRWRPAIGISLQWSVIRF